MHLPPDSSHLALQILLTCSRQTNRHGQSLFGHFSKRANCFRRSRTNALSLSSSASSSVASRCFPFIIMDLKPHTNPSCGACHLDRCRISRPGGARKQRQEPICPARSGDHLAGRLWAPDGEPNNRGLQPASFSFSFERELAAPRSNRSWVRFGVFMWFGAVSADCAVFLLGHAFSHL